MKQFRVIERSVSLMLMLSLLSAAYAAKSSDLLLTADKVSGAAVAGAAIDRELSPAATGFSPFADRFPGKRFIGGYAGGSSSYGDYANGYDSHLGNYAAGGYYHPSSARLLGGAYGGYPGYGGYSMYGGGIGYNSYPYNSYYYGSRLGLGGYPSTYSRLGYPNYPSSYYTGGNYGSSIIGGGLGGPLVGSAGYLPSVAGAYPYGPAAITGTVY